MNTKSNKSVDAIKATEALWNEIPLVV